MCGKDHAVKKRLGETLTYIVFGVALFAALMNLSSVWAFLGKVISIMLPVVVGLIIAFILSVPQNAFERLICKAFPKICKNLKLLTAFGFALTVISLALVVALVITVAVPAIKTSAVSAWNMIEEKLPGIISDLEARGIDTELLRQIASRLDTEKIGQLITGSAGAVLGSVVDVSVSIVSGAFTACISCVIGIYALFSRRELSRQCKKVLYAYSKKDTADRICHIVTCFKDSHTKFLSGQCVEAVILGILIFIAFTAFGLPYAGLTALLTAFFAMVPYVGAFISCAVGCFLILITDPGKALVGLIVYLAVQFIENQFIYPHVVGTSVGLSALWTLVAALIGGNLFGLVGMIFFIPIMAAIHNLIREDIEKRAVRAAEGEKQIESES